MTAAIAYAYFTSNMRRQVEVLLPVLCIGNLVLICRMKVFVLLRVWNAGNGPASTSTEWRLLSLEFEVTAFILMHNDLRNLVNLISWQCHGSRNFEFQFVPPLGCCT